ncbi:MAG: M1 family metallopeptidase [Planctomycetota bacterium]|nr:M1 family metallopeptidase [Planctomycetota bacterium]
MTTLQRSLSAAAALCLFSCSAATLRAQRELDELIASAPAHLRAGLRGETRTIRRDVPLTRTIRRGLAAGTRALNGRPGPNYWQLRTDFDIRARIDADTQTIYGSETITVHNQSSGELSRLYLRLDHNLFRFGVQRGASVPAERTDGMVVTRIAVDGEDAAIAAGGRRRGRRGGGKATAVGLDQTVAAVMLAAPIAAGAVAEVEIDWHTKLPGGDGGRGHRMTQRWGDTLFQPTQWFPRLCKYDDLHGWVTSPYLGPSEFYNNFGSFDVALDVPGGWLVSATGTLQNAEEVLSATVRERLAKVTESDDELVIVGEDERGAGKATAAGDRLTWRFHADLVNDFAWATARDYVWTATRATIPERGPVPIHMLFLPERANRFARAGRITRHALEFYSDLWIPYEFPQLTMQDGPSAGMEYPMVINSNQGAADHEAAHQWWPMMLGTNETMYGWMDEGFNSYMNILSGAHARGRTANLDGRGQLYGRRAGDESEGPMMWSANYGGEQYGFVTYMKVPMMLSMLGGVVGDDRVQAGIKEYARAWLFKHPCPWDFAFFMSDYLKVDLGWFWYYWMWTTAAVDGSIQAVRQDGDDVVVVVRQDGDMPSPVVLEVEWKGAVRDAGVDGGAPLGRKKLRITHPVEVWFGGARTFEARFEGKVVDLAKVALDPDGRFPDGAREDNVWPR